MLYSGNTKVNVIKK
uniref:Uncharacterized protein n=1 Tax=Anguilla anguilla TaxID=7936 RepID=A0A0E9PHB5_ANGAN